MSNILFPEQLVYLNQFKNPTDKLLSEIEEFSRERSIPILGWQTAQFLEQFIKIKQPIKVLEIGTAVAYSTIRIARCLNNNSTIDTIERSTDCIRLAEKNISMSDVSDKINLIPGDALELIPKLEKSYDFIFLDADKNEYVDLFELSLDLLSDNGIYFVDNLLWQGFTARKDVPKKFSTSTNNIRSFNKLFKSCEKLDSEIFSIGDGVGVGIKKPA